MYHYKPFAVANLLLAAFLSINIYVAFSGFIHRIPVFIILMFIFTQSYWIVRYISYRAGKYLPGVIFLPVSTLFSVFTVAVTYAALADLVWLILFIIPYRPLFNAYNNNLYPVGIMMVLLTVITYFIGLYNARTPKVIRYSVKLDKKLPYPVKIVLLADIHLNSYTSKRVIQRMVGISNGLKPDMVLFAGDILDGEPEPFLRREFNKILNALESKYGTFAVLGNHEYYSFTVDEMTAAYEKSGMTVLRDKVHLFKELNIALIGRDDYMSYMFGVPRKPMKEIVREVPENMASLLLEHQPRNSTISRAIENGIDLQLSGHTHNGQTFPMNYLMKAVYKKAWGLWKHGTYNLVVTCGFGTWGTNIRTFSVAEIAYIDVEGQ